MDASTILGGGEDRLLPALQADKAAEHRCILLRLLRERTHALDATIVAGVEVQLREAVEAFKRDRARASLVSLLGQVLASANAIPVDVVAMIAAFVDARTGAQELAPHRVPIVVGAQSTRGALDADPAFE